MTVANCCYTMGGGFRQWKARATAGALARQQPRPAIYRLRGSITVDPRGCGEGAAPLGGSLWEEVRAARAGSYLRIRAFAAPFSGALSPRGDSL